MGQCQLSELAVIRQARMGDDQNQIPMSFQQPANGLDARVISLMRAVAAVDDHRGARLGHQLPGPVQQRVVRVEVSDLDMDLEDFDARFEAVFDLLLGAGLGIKGAGGDRLRVVRREVPRVLIEPAGHARAVRVVQGAEPGDSQLLEGGDALRFVGAVADRPR